MAQQKGHKPFEGRVGSLSYFKKGDGYQVREKTGINGGRIATDPNYERTRENMLEFGRCARYGKTLRNAFRPLLLLASDGKMSSRLSGAMRQVILADPISARGYRNIMDGNAELLEGFEFNLDGTLREVFGAPFTTTIDKAAGTLGVAIPGFAPAKMVKSPLGATHLLVYGGAAAIDFESEDVEVQILYSDPLGVKDLTDSAPINFNFQLSPGKPWPLFLVLGVEFYQEVNGKRYPLNSGVGSPLSLVKVVGY